MRRTRNFGLLALLCASAGMAQIQPTPGEEDPHLQTVDYGAGQIVQLRSAPGYQLMVELSPDEAVKSVALGDSAAWQVSVNKAGDRLFLKPAQGDASTNMTVVTSVRVYHFDLVALVEVPTDLPYTVRFRYPIQEFRTAGSASGNGQAAAQPSSRYKISGDHLLRPISVTDDGQRTYIKWPGASPIPAVYAPDRLGNEALLNGMMGTDDVYVVDGVPQQLIFRIDRSVARAERVAKRKGR